MLNWLILFGIYFLGITVGRVHGIFPFIFGMTGGALIAYAHFKMRDGDIWRMITRTNELIEKLKREEENENNKAQNQKEDSEGNS